MAEAVHDDDRGAPAGSQRGRGGPRSARLGLGTLTIDVDGVVVSTGLQVERAFRGFNPHHRKVPSYYPILAHGAETTHILRVKNRSDNVHDGKASLPFLRELWDHVVATRRPAPRHPIPHGCGFFFREDVLRWLRGRPVGYAIKVPFYTWLDLQAEIRRHGMWTRVTHDVSGFALRDAITPWDSPIAVTIYRKKVRHRTAKNFQLDRQEARRLCRRELAQTSGVSGSFSLR